MYSQYASHMQGYITHLVLRKLNADIQTIHRMHIHVLTTCITHTGLHNTSGLGRELVGHFNTPNRCFLYRQISVDLSGNLWRYSEFQNI